MQLDAGVCKSVTMVQDAMNAVDAVYGKIGEDMGGVQVKQAQTQMSRSNN